MISRNRSSKTIVVDEGVPVDPTDAVASVTDIVRPGSLKRIPSATILASAIGYSSTAELIDLSHPG